MKKDLIPEESAEVPINICKWTDNYTYHRNALLELRRMAVLMNLLLEKSRHVNAVSFTCPNTANSLRKVKCIFKEILEDQHPYLELTNTWQLGNSCSKWEFSFKVNVISEMWNKKTDIEKAECGDIPTEENYIIQLCRFPKSHSSEYHIHSHLSHDGTGYQALVVDNMEIRIHEFHEFHGYKIVVVNHRRSTLNLSKADTLIESIIDAGFIPEVISF